MFRDYWDEVEELHRAYNMLVLRFTKVWHSPGDPWDKCVCVYNVTLLGGGMLIHQEVHNRVVVHNGGIATPVDVSLY